MLDLGLPSGTLWCDRNIGDHTPFIIFMLIITIVIVHVVKDILDIIL